MKRQSVGLVTMEDRREQSDALRNKSEAEQEAYFDNLEKEKELN